MSMKKRNPLKRQEEDFYRTPRDCLDALLSVETIAGPVWEPACGDGRLSRVLKLAGYDVISSDLVDRGYGEPGIDFLATGELRAPVVITNPPYVGRMPEDFAEHALALGARKVMLLMRLSWLEGEGRRGRIFSANPPDRVWCLSFRPTLWHGGDAWARDTGGAISYAWFVWEAGATRPAGNLGGFTGGWLPRPATPTGLEAALLALEWSIERLIAITGAHANG